MITFGLISRIAASCAFLLPVIGPAGAASSSWSDAMGGRLRLIAPGGAASATGELRAGIEIDLDDGWKTYWRSPGDAGIPPDFDFSASINLKNAEIHFPYPKRDKDGDAVSIVYKRDVVFPLDITPIDPALPVILRLTALYGVCEEICVPADGKASLILSAVTAPDEAIANRIAAARDLVPVKTDSEGHLSVQSVIAATDDKTGKPALDVTIRLPDPSAKHDMFVEGPLNWFLPAPTRLGDAPGGARYRVDLSEIPKNAELAGTDLRFTLLNKGRAAEQIWRLTGAF